MADTQTKPEGKDIVSRRHVEWMEHQTRWQWLLDSYEGGQRYRNAIYGTDRKGYPLRNLIRHKREYPDQSEYPNTGATGYGAGLPSPAGLNADFVFGPFAGLIGADPGATAQDDDYELRRARTPVPEWVSDAVECHLGKIYDQEVMRDGPEPLIEWWKDVTGTGVCVDDWMSDTIAPMLMVLGQLDVLFDHPPVPDGVAIATQADVNKHNLSRCIASYILPENMVWWKLDKGGRYEECLVKEYVDPSQWTQMPTFQDRAATVEWAKAYTRFRHWTAKSSSLYDYDGNAVAEPREHRFGRVPIVRVFDVRRHRSPHVGKSRYEPVAELMKEYFNILSELSFSNTLQAHPLLSGPQEFCSGDDTLSIGPGYILPKKHDSTSGRYEGWEYVSPPKDPAESLRLNMHDLIDASDKASKQTKPAGVRGQSSGTVGQSGISKQLDATEGNKLLSRICKTLARAERDFLEFALLVIGDGPPKPSDLEAAKVTYPSRFDLFDLGELGDVIAEFQSAIATAGEAPVAEKLLLSTYLRRALVGLPDETYEELDEELDQVLEEKAKLKEQGKEAGMALALASAKSRGISSDDDALEEGGTDEEQAGADPTGESGQTLVDSPVI
ncbi:hypothetical protein [Singulisphaera sp. PoT]|uniref:hypothetical protein n=1 Tax=Singulisphaera sp. PoT TaxID=3411797 RepID=UPI003BF5D4D3